MCFIFDITTVLAKARVIHSVCDHQVCHRSLPASESVSSGLQRRWHWLLGSDGKAVLSQVMSAGGQSLGPGGCCSWPLVFAPGSFLYGAGERSEAGWEAAQWQSCVCA